MWTILGRPQVAQRMGVAERFFTVLPQSRALMRHYRSLAPLYPPLVAARRLPAADLLITSSYAFAHGFTTRNHAPQLCYCHSPLRFAWSMTSDYGRDLGAGRVGMAAVRALAAGMRVTDRRAAQRVNRYLAPSRHVAGQLESFYGRSVEVVFPPVDCERFHPADDAGHDDYFLYSSRLIEPYKQPTLAVEAFRGLSHRLVMAGDGPALPELRRIAGPNVEFVGHLDDAELIPLMQRCAAVIFPSRDDFGMVPVEVMACGRPVIAFGAGGAIETVIPGETGELFASQDRDSLRAAVEAFDPDAYDPRRIRAHAEGWGAERFQARIRATARAMLG